MATNTKQETPTQLDIEILNILRCEPPSSKCDFFTYGRLPRSVFQLLQNLGDIRDIISENSGRFLKITEKEKHHTINFSDETDIGTIIANTYNNISTRSDAKLLVRTELKGTDNKTYDLTCLALEVYREKGNGHPIWQLGLYITEKGTNKIRYGEETIIDIPFGDNKRISVQSKVAMFMTSLKAGVSYDPTMVGITSNPKKFHYIKRFLEESAEAKIVSPQEFQENRAKWFRYLLGTMDVRETLKFEDRCGYKVGFRNYRVELVSYALEKGTTGHFFIVTLADTEKDPKLPNERTLFEGPYHYGKALSRFWEAGNMYWDLLHHNAEKGSKPFEINRTFKYGTVVKDPQGHPITLASFETPYDLDSKPLEEGSVHHYLELWNSEPNPLRLDEGVNFEEGIHPRAFMGRLLDTLSKTTYESGSHFVQQAIEKGVPLINP